MYLAKSLLELSKDDPLVGRAEVREVTPVSDVTLWRWIAKGAFPEPIKIGRDRFWRLSVLKRWMEANPGKATGGPTSDPDEPVSAALAA